MSKMMTKEEHREHHQSLHRALDQLLADFLQNGGGLEYDAQGRMGTARPIKDLLDWSYRQVQEPDHEP